MLVLTLWARGAAAEQLVTQFLFLNHLNGQVLYFEDKDDEITLMDSYLENRHGNGIKVQGYLPPVCFKFPELLNVISTS